GTHPIERGPSQRSTIAAPVLFSRTTPSGYRSTRCWRTGSNSSRANRQRTGTDVAVSVTSGLQVGVMDRVDHEPQHLDLEGQRGERAALCLDCRAVRPHELQALLTISWRLRQPALEIVEPLGTDPRVMLRERGDTLPHQIRCKQLGER